MKNDFIQSVKYDFSKKRNKNMLCLKLLFRIYGKTGLWVKQAILSTKLAQRN